MPCSRAMRRIHLSALMLMLSGVLDRDLRKCLGARPGRFELLPRARGDVEIGARDGAVGLRHHRGTSAVGLLADADVERKAAEQLHAVLFGHTGAAAGAEQSLFVA